MTRKLVNKNIVISPQPIEPPRKKVDRPQIAFNLNEEEARLKEEFVDLVGGRGIKPVLVEFMRRFVVNRGRISTIGAEDTAAAELHELQNTSSPIAPKTAEERDHVAGMLALFRDHSALAEGPREVIKGLLSFWVRRAKEQRRCENRLRFSPDWRWHASALHGA